MGFDEGRVVFDRPDLTYAPGQMVQGRLEFQQDKDKTFRGLYLKAKGFCETHWETRETRRVDDREEVYYEPHDAYELYFEQVVYLMGGKSGECHLKPGQHVFPFQILIPPHCPSSYEGSYGHIRYTFKFVVDRSFKIDQEKKITITVVSPKDLNKNPYCLEPLVFKFDEPYLCCCMSQGRVETFIKVPRAGFCPGETIPIEISCKNDSKLTIDRIQCKIKENRVYRTTDDSKYLEETIAKLSKATILSNTSRQWELEMVLPQMELHNLDGCSWIEIYYNFEVKISPEGCHSDTDASSRIILGNIPLRIGDQDTVMPIQQPAFNLAPYPQASPYPGPYPGANQVHPAGNGPYPGANVPYPSGQVPYPEGNVPYPEGNGPYPGGPAPYPGGHVPYPGGNVPYPGGNGPFPGGFSPIPGGNVPAVPYPAGSVPYPDGNVPYPGGNVPYIGGNVPYPAGNQEKAPLLQDNFQKTPYPGFIVPAENQEKSPRNEGSDLASQPPYNPSVENTPLLQDNSEKTPYHVNPPGNQEILPETSNPKYEAPQPPYNPNVPSGATIYNPNVTSSATPYNSNVPSSVTPYNSNVPFSVTPYNSNVPSSVTPYNSNVTSSATPYNTNLPSGATPYIPNVPSGATPYPATITVMPVPMPPLPDPVTEN